MPDNIPIGEWSAAMLTFDYAHRTCIEPCIFRLRFWPRVMRNAPSRYASSGPRKKVGAFTDSSSGPAMKTCLSSDEDPDAQFALGDVAAPLRSPGARSTQGNAPLASERFRFVPRTFRPIFDRLIVQRSMRAVCDPEGA